MREYIISAETIKRHTIAWTELALLIVAIIVTAQLLWDMP